MLPLLQTILGTKSSTATGGTEGASLVVILKESLGVGRLWH